MQEGGGRAKRLSPVRISSGLLSPRRPDAIRGGDRRPSRVTTVARVTVIVSSRRDRYIVSDLSDLSHRRPAGSFARLIQCSRDCRVVSVRCRVKIIGSRDTLRKERERERS